MILCYDLSGLYALDGIKSKAAQSALNPAETRPQLLSERDNSGRDAHHHRTYSYPFVYSVFGYCGETPCHTRSTDSAIDPLGDLQDTAAGRINERLQASVLTTRLIQHQRDADNEQRRASAKPIGGRVRCGHQSNQSVGEAAV